MVSYVPTPSSIFLPFLKRSVELTGKRKLDGNKMYTAAQRHTPVSQITGNENYTPNAIMMRNYYDKQK